MMIHPANLLPILTIGRSTAVVRLNKGRRALVDVADLPIVLPYRWHEMRGYACAYCPTRYSIQMHRIILGAERGDPLIDHINRNGLDNRRENLRFTSRAINRLNSKKNRNGTSRFRGVCKFKPTGKWCAKIRVAGKDRSLGHYVTEEDAARAWDAAALATWGSDAPLNFPMEEVAT